MNILTVKEIRNKFYSKSNIDDNIKSEFNKLYKEYIELKKENNDNYNDYYAVRMSEIYEQLKSYISDV